MPTKQKSSFVPDGYKASSSGSDFFTFKTGENKFRILTDALVGKEGWRDNKPFRRKGTDAHIDKDEVDIDDRTKKPKINDFMAVYVFDHEDNKVKVAQFNQVGIKKTIISYANDEDWGHPSNYDFKVSKSGEGLLTKYTITPSIPKALPKEAQKVVDEQSEFFDLAGALGIEE